MTSLMMWVLAHSGACPTMHLLLTLQKVPQPGKEVPSFPTLAMGNGVVPLQLCGSFFRGSSFFLGLPGVLTSYFLQITPLHWIPAIKEMHTPPSRLASIVGSLHMALSGQLRPALDRISLM